MADEIRPALTADEWAERDTGWIGDKREVRVCSAPGFDGSVLVCFSGRDANEGVNDPRALHALAALSLTGQPFGFTHAHLECLDEAVISEIQLGNEFDSCEGDGAETERQCDRLRALRAIIAALLPPRP